MALLRMFQLEGKELIRRALDTLVPVLPIRLLPDDFNKAVKWTKKILVDEGYSMLQLCHIWHVILRFPDVFYSHRSQLVPQILNCITRIGLPANVAAEFRLVSVAIADLVIRWEIKSMQPQKALTSVPHSDSSSAPLSLLPSPPVTTRKRIHSDDSSVSISPSGKVQKFEIKEIVKEFKSNGDLKTESDSNSKIEIVVPKEQKIDMVTEPLKLIVNEEVKEAMKEVGKEVVKEESGTRNSRSGSEKERGRYRLCYVIIMYIYMKVCVFDYL